MNEIIHGDCLDVIRKLPSESYDVVLADPPYGISFQSNQRTKSAKLKKLVNDNKPFIWWLYDSFRVAKPNSCLLCFCRWDVSEAFRFAIDLAGWTIRNPIVWDRQQIGMGNLKSSFGPSHDLIWFATKGKYAFPGRRLPDVFRCHRLAWQHLTHPTEKPIALIEELLGATVAPGGTVLDPFAGSGVVGQACVKMGYDYTGIEINEDYFSAAMKRMTP